MTSLDQISPKIRVSHHYKFKKNTNEENYRKGYCYAFHLFDGGQGTVIIEQQSYPVQKGSLIYIAPMQEHAFITDPEHLMSSYNIYFDAWSEVAMDRKHTLVRSADTFEPNYLTVIKPCQLLDQLPRFIPLQYYPQFIDLFVHIIRVQEKGRGHHALIASSLLYGWILELCQDTVTEDRFDYRIQRIIHRMEQDWKHYRHSTQWLAESGLHRTQFYDLFKKMTGMSPKSYLLKIKMSQAIAELMESNRTVTEISEGLGYPSIHYFSKQFHDYYGVAPSVYRTRRDVHR